MNGKPILFKGYLVLAVLEGWKTETRRIIKPQPPENWNWHGWVSSSTDRKLEGKATWAKEPTESVITHGLHAIKCPYGEIGGYLWIRENAYYWGHWVKNGHTKTGRQKWKSIIKEGTDVIYQANSKPDKTLKRGETGKGWIFRPGMFMPRWASRLKVETTEIKVERVQDITDESAVAEGVDRTNTSIPGYAKKRFQKLWDSINEKRGHGWIKNEWVWVVKFKRIDK